MANLTAPEHDRAAGNVTHGRAGDVWTDRIFRGVALVAGLTVLAILALIAYSTTKEAWPAFRAEGPVVHHFRRVDPERGPVRRAGVHLWNALHVVHRGRDRGAGVARDRAVHDGARRRAASAGRRSTSSTCSPRSRRSSTASGACSCSRPGSRRVYDIGRGRRRRHPGARPHLRRPGVRRPRAS